MSSRSTLTISAAITLALAALSLVGATAAEAALTSDACRAVRNAGF